MRCTTRSSTIGYTSFLIKNHWKTLVDIKFVVVAPDLIVWVFNSHKGVTEKKYRCSDENFSSATSGIPSLSP